MPRGRLKGRDWPIKFFEKKKCFPFQKGVFLNLQLTAHKPFVVLLLYTTLLLCSRVFSKNYVVGIAMLKLECLMLNFFYELNCTKTTNSEETHLLSSKKSSIRDPISLIFFGGISPTKKDNLLILLWSKKLFSKNGIFPKNMLNNNFYH